MPKDTTWSPEIADKAGRGALCARIQSITKDIQRAKQQGDSEKLSRLLCRLDIERQAFHKLYGKKVSNVPANSSV